MNASAALLVHTPDGSGQAVHPDVLHAPCGLLGFEYWMACTPYPFADDRLENPLVRVSQDGMTWTPYPGAPDPIVEAPAEPGWHHADTDLVVDQGRLFVFYISTKVGAGDTVVSWVSSEDALRWTGPRTTLNGKWIVSPSVLVDRTGTWRLWYVAHDGLASPRSSVLRHRRAPSPELLGSAAICDEDCTLHIPGHVVWHLDVAPGDAGMEALVAAFPLGADPSRSRLFRAVSTDGIRFLVTPPSPLLQPTWFGWDNRMIYRSTFQRLSSGRYRVWYSAASWGMRCGIGLLEGPMDRLVPVPLATRCAATPLLRKVREDLGGLAKYIASRLLPPWLIDRLLQLRQRLRRSTHK